jgi:hypothetical protein
MALLQTGPDSVGPAAVALEGLEAADSVDPAAGVSAVEDLAAEAAVDSVAVALARQVDAVDPAADSRDVAALTMA